MKICIVTIVDRNPNYGNRLQNYASKLIFESLGFEVETMIFEEYGLSFKEKIKYKIAEICGYKIVNVFSKWKLEKLKKENFIKFDKQYIKFCKYNNINFNTFDFYAIGSDQVWNASWYSVNKMRKEIYLLSFVEADKKICMAPSFGIDSLPDEWKAWFREHLNTFKKLGVREEAGAQIIKALTGRDADVLIDPTLLLGKDEWMKISAVPKDFKCNEPYILSYFLGGRSDEVDSDLKKYAFECDAKLINLLDYSQPSVFVSDPANFIYLISKAKLIVTDSFHACVFSFLFEKPFMAYNRSDAEDNMMSRINTFLLKFNLERKYIGNTLNNELIECNYQSGFITLDQERKKTLDFLRNSIIR